jgi:hypothetical protein
MLLRRSPGICPGTCSPLRVVQQQTGDESVFVVVSALYENVVGGPISIACESIHWMLGGPALCDRRGSDCNQCQESPAKDIHVPHQGLILCNGYRMKRKPQRGTFCVCALVESVWMEYEGSS